MPSKAKKKRKDIVAAHFEEIMVNICHTGGDDSSNIVNMYRKFIWQLFIDSTNSAML